MTFRRNSTPEITSRQLWDGDVNLHNLISIRRPASLEHLEKLIGHATHAEKLAALTGFQAMPVITKIEGGPEYVAVFCEKTDRIGKLAILKHLSVISMADKNGTATNQLLAMIEELNLSEEELKNVIPTNTKTWNISGTNGHKIIQLKRQAWPEEFNDVTRAYDMDFIAA